MNPAEFANIARTEETFWWFAGMQRILFGLLEWAWGDHAPGPVLEVGGGTGHIARKVAERFGVDVHVSDLAGEGLKYARAGGLTALLQCDARRLPVRDGSYGAVISLDMLVHLERGAELVAIAEMCRVLRPGGWLVVRAAAFDFLRSRHSEFVGERQRYTRRQLVGLMEECGLRVERATYLNCLLLPVAVMKFRVWEPLAGGEATSGLSPVAGWLNWALEGVLRVESAWVGMGGSFAVGQSVVVMGRKVAG